MPTQLDELGPQIARWLAPYLATELGIARPHGGVAASRDYDDILCGVFVNGLGISVLNRAADFFMKLRDDGQVGSIELAEHLSLGSPRSIAAALTNSLKQRSKALGLERPWRELESSDGRTVWADRDGIASRMVPAIQAELAQRVGV
jgi:hypothetical protein